MPTQIQIAKRWGVSQVRVCKLVKAGCPTNSYAAADKWREARGQLRPPTNQPSKGKSKQVVPQKKTSQSKLSKRMEAKEKAKPPENAKPKKPMRPLPVETGDSVTDTLNQIIYVTNSAHDKVMEAMQEDSSTVSARMIEYCRMVEAKLKVEKSSREEMVRRGTLINQFDILATCRAALETTMKRLRRVPIELGPQCTTDALTSTKVLEREMNSIMAAAAQTIRDLKPKSH